MGELNLPKRFCVAGEELVGERVTAYHKPGQIKTILQALSEEEVEIIRKLTFGKFIAIAELPAFSERFARHVLTWQLKVSNKNEIWVLFAGKPVRFSLREFAIVTWLPCGPIPTIKKKRKQRLTEEPYWGKLFGRISSTLRTNIDFDGI